MFGNRIREWAVIGLGLALGVGGGLVAVLTQAPAVQAVMPEPQSAVLPEPRPTTAPATSPELERERTELERKIAEIEVKRLKERLALLEAEAADIPASPPEKSPLPRPSRQVSTAPPPRPDSTPASSGARTLAYWNALNDIISRESAMRSAPGQVTASNALGFVAARTKAGQFAARSINELNTEDVDRDAAALGSELGAWYAEEETLSRQAHGLLGSSDRAARQGEPGQAWRGGEEQHRLKCEDLNRRGDVLRVKLSQRYRLAFPDLQ
jgi:hypothetical protein